MNGQLKTTTNFGSMWGGKLPMLEYVYGIIDSKIDFIELKTRRILEKFKTTDIAGAHRSDSWADLPSMSNLYVDNSESEQLFEHFETLSQSIYVLEQFKLTLNEENAFTIIQLLNDDNYLKLTEFQLNEMLASKTAA
jgi:hypothetical protein